VCAGGWGVITGKRGGKRWFSMIYWGQLEGDKEDVERSKKYKITRNTR